MQSITIPRQSLWQLLRFVIVGVLNTLVTLVVIFVCKSVLGVNPWLSNALGYVAGVINSFVWSRQWVFKAKDGALMRQIASFLIGFGVCYCLQFAVTWSLTNYTGLRDLLIATPVITLSGYAVATLIGMCCYTIAFFCYNRFVAFKPSGCQ